MGASRRNGQRTINLAVGGFGESFVLPSTASYSRSGTSYVLLLEDGKTKQVPVRVQFTDGKTVQVALLMQYRDAGDNRREGFMELTGRETIVATRQLEIGDGTTVHGNVAEW